MRLVPAISKGHAVFKGPELRCQAARQEDASRLCNKLIAKKNRFGQIAGNFLCERCKEEIEVRMVREGPAPGTRHHPQAGHPGQKRGPMQYQRLGEAHHFNAKGEVSPS